MVDFLKRAVATVPAVRAAVIFAVDPDQPLADRATIESLLSCTLSPDGFRCALLLTFGAVGLMLALVGLCGAASRLVEDRRREIGGRVRKGGGGIGTRSGV